MFLKKLKALNVSKKIKLHQIFLKKLKALNVSKKIKSIKCF